MEQEINSMLSQTKKSLEHQYNTRLEFKPKEIAIEILKILNGQPLNREYKYFFWPTASLALSLEVAHSQAQREDLLDILITYYKRWARKGGRLYYLDQIMNGYTLLYLFEIDGEWWIKESLQKMSNYIEKYPRTSTGGLPYRTNNPEVTLVDYLGMICPFLSRYGRTFNSEEASKLSTVLLEDFLSNGMDVKTGLPYHGFRSGTPEKLGIIGWGRGVGWLLIGMVDTLAFLDRSSEEFPKLLNQFRLLLNSTIKYQDEDGYFKWVLNANNGHKDTSATAMIGYSIKRAIDLDLINTEYAHYAEKSLQALLSSTKNGLVFDSSAECQGLGMYPQRYEWNLWGQGFGTAFALTMLK
jgi:rhamnogalacturonyl hydrolase YesR